MEQYKMSDGNTIYFTTMFGLNFDNRKVTLCVIETKSKKFFSGVSFLAPNELHVDYKLGKRLALKRACLANPKWNFASIPNMFLDDIYVKIPTSSNYKEYWHEIRVQMRKENGNE